MRKIRRAKKYAKSVHDEQEKKLEFSDLGEDDGEDIDSYVENRIRPYPPHITPLEENKEYIIDKFTPEMEEESKISSRVSRHKRNNSSFLEEAFLGGFHKQDKGEKEVIVSEKSNFNFNNPKEETKEDYYNEPEPPNPCLQEEPSNPSAVPNPLISPTSAPLASKKIQDKIRSLHPEGPDPSADLQKYSSVQNPKVVQNSLKNLASGEPNNNDLDSVRSSNY